MRKIAVVGMERIGKTTRIHEAISILQGEGIECLYAPEITMQPQNIHLELTGDSMKQRLVVLDQMVQEDRLMITPYKSFLIVDRSPLESAMYYAETDPGYPNNVDALTSGIIELARAWMFTYDLIIYITSQDFNPMTNKHFSKRDRHAWGIRYARLSSGVAALDTACKVHSVDNPTGNDLATIIIKELP